MVGVEAVHSEPEDYVGILHIRIGIKPHRRLPGHLAGLKACAALCSVIYGAEGVGKAVQVLSVPLCISRKKRNAVRAVFFFHLQQIVRYGLICLIPGDWLKLPFAPLTHALKRCL